MSELRSRIHQDDGQERAPTPRQVQKEGLQLNGGGRRNSTLRLLFNISLPSIRGDSWADSDSDYDDPLQRHFFSPFLLLPDNVQISARNPFFKCRKAAFHFWGSCIYFAWGSVPRLGEVDHIGFFYIMEGMGNTRHILGENCHSFYFFRLYHSVTTGHRGTGWDKVLLLLVYYLLMPQRRDTFLTHAAALSCSVPVYSKVSNHPQTIELNIQAEPHILPFRIPRGSPVACKI